MPISDFTRLATLSDEERRKQIRSVSNPSRQDRQKDFSSFLESAQQEQPSTASPTRDVRSSFSQIAQRIRPELEQKSDRNRQRLKELEQQRGFDREKALKPAKDKVREQANKAGIELSEEEIEEITLQNIQVPEVEEPEEPDLSFKGFLSAFGPAEDGGIPILETKAERAIKDAVVEQSPFLVGNIQTMLSRTLNILNRGSTPGTLGEILNIFGDSEALVPKASDSLEKRAEKNIRLGRDLTAARMIKERQRIKEGGEPQPELELIRDVAAGATSLIPAAIGGLGGFAVGGPVGGVRGARLGAGVGGFSTSFLLEGGAAVNEAKLFLENSEEESLREKANDEKFLDAIGLSVGTLGGILEFLPITRLINDLPGASQVKKSLTRNVTRGLLQRSLQTTGKIGSQGILEASTEGGQEVIANAAAKTYDENRELFENVSKAAFIGSIIGAGAKGVSLTAGRTAQATQELVESSRQLSLDVGGDAGFVKIPANLLRKAQQSDNAESFENNLTDKERNSILEQGASPEDVFLGQEKIRLDFIREEIAGEVSPNRRVKSFPKKISKDQFVSKGQVFDSIEHETEPDFSNKGKVRRTIFARNKNNGEIKRFDFVESKRTGEETVEIFNVDENGQANLEETQELTEFQQQFETLNDIGEIVKLETSKTGNVEFVEPQNVAQRAERAVSPPSAQKILGREQASLVDQGRTREDVALRRRLRREQTVSRRGLLEGVRRERQVQQRIRKEEIENLKRRNELRLLRQRIQDRFRFIMQGIRQGTINTKREVKEVQTELIDIIEASLQKEERGGFLRTLKNIQTRRQFIRNAPKINQMIDRAINSREVRRLKQQIQKEVRESRPRIGERKVRESKFGPEVTRVINFLDGKTEEGTVKIPVEQEIADVESQIAEREEENRPTKRLRKRLAELKRGEVEPEKVRPGRGFHLRGDRQRAMNEIDSNIEQYGTIDENGMTPVVPQDIADRNALLYMVGIQSMTVQELRTTLENIQSLKEDGVLETRRKASNKEGELERVQDNSSVEFDAPDSRPPELGELGQEINPVVRVWEMMENILLSTRNIVEKLTRQRDTEFRVADWVAEKTRVARNGHTRTSNRWHDMKNREFRRIFGVQKGRVVRDLNRREVVFQGKNRLGEDVTISLSQFEAAYWWAEMQDPSVLPAFETEMNFTASMFKAIEDFVDPKVKEYTLFIKDELFQTVRGEVNPYHQEKFGLDIANNPNYIPIIGVSRGDVEQTTNLLVGQDFAHRDSTIPSAVKARTGRNGGLKRISIDKVARRHIEKMSWFLHFDELVSDFRRVFGSEQVKDVIHRQKGGRELFKTLNDKIDNIARGGMAAQMQIGGMDFLISNFTRASLMAPNFVPFFKQLTSIPAFTIGRGSVTYPELIQGSLIYLQNPVEWTRLLAKSDMIFERLATGFNRETALAFRRGDGDFFIKEEQMTLREFLKKSLITPTRGGDMVAIMPGMTAKYVQTKKRLESEGQLSEEEINNQAMAEAENLTTRTQQSPRIEDIGNLQVINSIVRAMTMYSTTPIQYFRETTLSVRRYIRGQESAKDITRTVFTSWVILPALFQYVSMGLPGVFGDFEDEHRNRLIRSLILGPINYYPAVGNLAKTYYDAFSSGENWKEVSQSISPLFSTPTTIQDAFVTLNGILFKETKIGESKMENWGNLAEELYTIIAQTMGILPSQAPRTIEGILDLINGDTKDIRRLLFSEFALGVERRSGQTLPAGSAGDFSEGGILENLDGEGGGALNTQEGGSILENLP